MSVSYAPTKLRVPPGFEYVLEGLAREVLREQPEDIIVFAAEYFKNKLTLKDGKMCDYFACFMVFAIDDNLNWRSLIRTGWAIFGIISR